jgi:hypothetical protein
VYLMLSPCDVSLCDALRCISHIRALVLLWPAGCCTSCERLHLKEQSMPPNEHRDGEPLPQDPRDSRRDAGSQREPGNAGAPAESTEAMKQSNATRSNVHPEQTAEVPHGTGDHPEPPGGGGRPSQRKRAGDPRKS